MLLRMEKEEESNLRTGTVHREVPVVVPFLIEPTNPRTSWGEKGPVVLEREGRAASTGEGRFWKRPPNIDRGKWGIKERVSTAWLRGNVLHT